MKGLDRVLIPFVFVIETRLSLLAYNSEIEFLKHTASNSRTSILTLFEQSLSFSRRSRISSTSELEWAPFFGDVSAA